MVASASISRRYRHIFTYRYNDAFSHRRRLVLVCRKSLKRKFKDNAEAANRAHQRGLLLASGLVAGSAVMGLY